MYLVRVPHGIQFAAVNGHKHEQPGDCSAPAGITTPDKGYSKQMLKSPAWAAGHDSSPGCPQWLFESIGVKSGGQSILLRSKQYTRESWQNTCQDQSLTRNVRHVPDKRALQEISLAEDSNGRVKTTSAVMSSSFSAPPVGKLHDE